MLRVKKLAPGAILPTVGHPGEDLGYDLYSLEDVTLFPNVPTLIRTGLAIELPGFGFLIRDRSSMANRGIVVSGGVIDAGYRGEVKVLLTLLNPNEFWSEEITAGDKIAQLIPLQVWTSFSVVRVKKLTGTSRGNKGFGSTGR